VKRLFKSSAWIGFELGLRVRWIVRHNSLSDSVISMTVPLVQGSRRLLDLCSELSFAHL